MTGSTPPVYSKGNESKNAGLTLLIFFVWPVLGFLLACKDFRNKNNHKIIMMFFALYGLLFYLNPAMDGQRRADTLIEIHQKSFDQLGAVFDTLYEETIDFAEPVIMYVVSRFTDFYGILFAVYALLFGALMLYFLKRMYGHYQISYNKNALLFLVLLICINPINNINGFRMWTAAWIFAVGVMSYLHHQKYKYVLVAAVSFFVHFSFFPLVILFLIYTLFKNKPIIYGSIALITFFIAELNIQQFQEYAALLGQASEVKAKAYTGEEYIEKVSELGGQTAWYIIAITKATQYFVLTTLLILFSKTKGKFKNKVTANFYSYTLLLLSFANLASLLPSGGRFYTVFYIFATSTALLYYQYESPEKKLTLFNKIGIPVVALAVVFAFRLFSDSASAYLLGPSFLMPWAFSENISLQSIIF